MSQMPPTAMSIAQKYPQQPLAFEQPHETSSLQVVAVINKVNFLVPKCTIDQNAHGSTDSAEITLPIKGAPDFTAWLYVNPSMIAPIPVQIYVGLFQGTQAGGVSTSGLTQMFSGQLDLYGIKLKADSVTFKCRSLGAPLVDNRITAIPRNMKTTDFVKKMAAQYGLSTNIQLPSGQYPLTVAEVYAHSFAVGLQNQRIWDLLLTMANFDDVDVWVSGSTLNYCAPGQVSRTTLDLKYGRDLIDLGIDHAPLFSKQIRVEVRTYNKHTKQASIQRVETSPGGGVKITTSSKTVTATPQFGTANTSSTSISSTGAQTTTSTTSTGGSASSTTGQGSESNIERYIIYKPGISPQAANQLANATWRRISMQEFSVNITLPLTRSKLPMLNITNLIRLHGTPFVKANSTYWPRKYTYDIDIESGAILTIEAVNHELPQGAV